MCITFDQFCVLFDWIYLRYANKITNHYLFYFHVFSWTKAKYKKVHVKSVGRFVLLASLSFPRFSGIQSSSPFMI